MKKLFRSAWFITKYGLVFITLAFLTINFSQLASIFLANNDFVYIKIFIYFIAGFLLFPVLSYVVKKDSSEEEVNEVMTEVNKLRLLCLVLICLVQFHAF